MFSYAQEAINRFQKGIPSIPAVIQCEPAPDVADAVFSGLGGKDGNLVYLALHVGKNEANPAAVGRWAESVFIKTPFDCHRCFMLAGYDNDPRELWDIPEARALCKALYKDAEGKVRPWVRLLSWSELPVGNYTPPSTPFTASCRAHHDSNGWAPGIFFLAMMGEGVPIKLAPGPHGLGYLGLFNDSFEQKVQQDVFGEAGKFALRASEFARLRQAKRRKPR